MARPRMSVESMATDYWLLFSLLWLISTHDCGGVCGDNHTPTRRHKQPHNAESQASLFLRLVSCCALNSHATAYDLS